jgi:hypothetical protein
VNAGNHATGDDGGAVLRHGKTPLDVVDRCR